MKRYRIRKNSPLYYAMYCTAGLGLVGGIYAWMLLLSVAGGQI